MTAFTQSDLDSLRLDLSIKAKNGINFIVAAILVWLAVSYIWTLSIGIGQKNLYTFFAGGAMLPLALLFSRVFRTSWVLPDNALQPLGLWLNLAQLAYFPILFFVFARHPDHFIMVYVIITGAHFLPFAWFYNTKSFAVMAVLISFGAMWLGFALAVERLYLIPLLLSGSLVVLAIWLTADYRAKHKTAHPLSNTPVNP